jgi:hypothetical protein
MADKFRGGDHDHDVSDFPLERSDLWPLSEYSHAYRELGRQVGAKALRLVCDLRALGAQLAHGILLVGAGNAQARDELSRCAIFCNPLKNQKLRRAPSLLP